MATMCNVYDGGGLCTYVDNPLKSLQCHLMAYPICHPIETIVILAVVIGVGVYLFKKKKKKKR